MGRAVFMEQNTKDRAVHLLMEPQISANTKATELILCLMTIAKSWLHTNKSTFELPNKTKMKVLEWPSQSPD